jgi:hypothetical protein
MTHGIDPILSYAQAETRINTVKPFRSGEAKGLTPLGRRRGNKRTIRKDGNGDIHCRLYDTDITTFKSNGDIIIRVDKWPTMTTGNALSALHDVPLYIHDQRLLMGAGEPRIEKSNFGWDYRQWNYVPLRNNGECVFRRDPNGALVAVDVPQRVVHKMIRREANNVKRMCQPFRDYLLAQYKLRGGASASEAECEAIFPVDKSSKYSWLTGVNSYYCVEPRKGRAPNWEKVQQFVEWVTDESEEQHASFYKAALVTTSCFLNVRHRGVPKPVPESYKIAMAALDTVLLYFYRDRCFKEEPIQGSDNWRRDPNLMYFHPDDERT